MSITGETRNFMKWLAEDFSLSTPVSEVVRQTAMQSTIVTDGAEDLKVKFYCRSMYVINMANYLYKVNQNTNRLANGSELMKIVNFSRVLF